MSFWPGAAYGGFKPREGWCPRRKVGQRVDAPRNPGLLSAGSVESPFAAFAGLAHAFGIELIAEGGRPRSRRHYGGGVYRIRGWP